jgi:serine/threonine-protein kinase
MTLDDLKTAWADLDRKLTFTQAAVHRLHTTHALDRAKSSLRPLAWKLGWELLEGVAAAVLTGVLLANNFAETRFALPGVALLALAVGGVAATLRQVVLLRRLDYSAPVVDIQKHLAELRAFRLRAWLGVVFLCPVIWAAGVVVLPKAVGVDVYDGFGWPWVVANFAFGVVFLVVAVAAARKLADRFRGSKWLTKLADDLTGRSLARAAEHVRQAAEFTAPMP